MQSAKNLATAMEHYKEHPSTDYHPIVRECSLSFLGNATVKLSFSFLSNKYVNVGLEPGWSGCIQTVTTPYVTVI